MLFFRANHSEPKTMVNSRIARTVGGGGGTGGIRRFAFSFRVLASAISIALCIFFTVSFLFTVHSHSPDQSHSVSFGFFTRLPYFPTFLVCFSLFLPFFCKNVSRETIRGGILWYLFLHLDFVFKSVIGVLVLDLNSCVRVWRIRLSLDPVVACGVIFSREINMFLQLGNFEWECY